MKRTFDLPVCGPNGQKVFTEKRKLLKQKRAKKFCNLIIQKFVKSRVAANSSECGGVTAMYARRAAHSMEEEAAL